MPVHPAVGLASREGKPDLSDFAQTLDEMADLPISHVEIPAYHYDLALAGKLIAQRVAEFERFCRDRPFGFILNPAENMCRMSESALAL